MLESLFNNIACIQACNFIKETPTQVICCEYCEISKNTYFEKYLRTAASVICFWFLKLFGFIKLVNTAAIIAY